MAKRRSVQIITRCGAAIDLLRERYQSRRHGDRESRRSLIQPALRRGQLGEAMHCFSPYILQCRRDAEALAIAHDGYQQRFACLPIVMKRQHVAGHPSVVSKAAPDLLAAGPSSLSGGSLAP